MSFFSNWWDVIVFAVLAIIHIASWLEIKTKLSGAPMNCNEQRSLGATTLGSASTAGITAVSILIPASLLIVQLAAQPGMPLPFAAVSNVFRASIWFLVSLFFGLIIVFLIPMYAQKHNVARNLSTGIPFGPQLLALLIGMARLVIGLYYTIYK